MQKNLTKYEIERNENSMASPVAHEIVGILRIHKQ